MSVRLRNVTFFNAGWCRQLGYFTGHTPWRFQRFYAVFAYFEHPQHGACLIDTGYSQRVWPASRRLPARAHRWATPITAPPDTNPTEVLCRAGVTPTDIRQVFLSHFHVDHIGGVGCFPGVEFIYRGDAYDALRRLPEVAQVHNGFLRGLLPPGFPEHGQAIRDASFAPGVGVLERLACLDYFGDGSLILVDLPGHAIGHTGYLLNTDDASLFYIVDASWDIALMRAGKKLPWISRAVQHNWTDYHQTQQKLLELASATQLLACHCPEMQQHVANA